MKKNGLIVFLSIMSFSMLNAQADCFLKYYYTGKISTNTRKTKSSSNIYIQLPSLELLMNLIHKTKGFINVKVNDSLSFEKESVTIGSSIFCGTPESVMENIFKRNDGFYTFYIIKSQRKYKKKISIKNITFINKNGMMYINLPVIVL